jgi:hypothetical protein
VSSDLAILKSNQDIRDLHSDVEHAIHNKDVHQLLQAYVEGADFSTPFIDSVLRLQVSLLI